MVCIPLCLPKIVKNLRYKKNNFMLSVRWNRSPSIHQTDFVFVPLFLKQILTKQNIASTKNSQEFLALQVPVVRRNKATNSSTSNHPFFSFNENLVFANLFKLFRVARTFAREVCPLGIKMKKNMTVVLFFSLSLTANCPCECDGN